MWLSLACSYSHQNRAVKIGIACDDVCIEQPLQTIEINGFYDDHS